MLLLCQLIPASLPPTCCTEGPGSCLTPSSWAAALAPQLPAPAAAGLYTGCHEFVGRNTLKEARFIAQFAIAAYGAANLSHMQRFALRTVAPLRRRVVEGALPPVKQARECKGSACRGQDDWVGLLPGQLPLAGSETSALRKPQPSWCSWPDSSPALLPSPL